MVNLLYFIGAFVLTELIECGVAACFKSKRLVYAVFLCNLLTNPLLNLLLMVYTNFISQSYYWPVVAALEVCVVVGEAFIIKAMMKNSDCELERAKISSGFLRGKALFSYKRALLLSLLFNASSFAVGLFAAFLITGKI